MEAAYLAVARFRKPHGLKGDALCWVLTDEPERVLTAGRELTPIDEDGHPTGEPLVVERQRPYHRSWLLKFRGIGDRGVLEQWDQVLLGVRHDELNPPGEGQMYEHEVPGARVIAGDGTPLGEATGLVDAPGTRLLAVDVGGREVLVPFRPPILVRVSRSERTIVVDPPPGLLEL